jgi:aminopeptidase
VTAGGAWARKVLIPRGPCGPKVASTGEVSIERGAFEHWTELARQVVRVSLRLGWNDVFEIYTYVPTIPLAEALALEARRTGSDTHLTLMTDDLWFTSMNELSTRWLRAPSPAERALNATVTAHIYLGGPADARRMRDIPPEKFDANATGGSRQDEPLRRRRVRGVDLSIGRLTPERAEAYGLDFARWRRSYEAALGVDLRTIQKAGASRARALTGRQKVRVTSDSGTDLEFQTKPIVPAVDDGIISPADIRRGFVETSLPAGRLEAVIRPETARGEVRCRDPIFFAGRTIRGLRLGIEKGKIAEADAEENADLLEHALSSETKSRARLGWFTVGLNPAAEPVMLDNSIVKDDVGIGLGPHWELERTKADPTLSFYVTIGPSHLEIERP